MFIAHINDKEIQSCKDHSIGVACIARKKLEGVGLGNTAYLAGVLHDAGKYTDEFKEYIEKAHNKIVSNDL